MPRKASRPVPTIQGSWRGWHVVDGGRLAPQAALGGVGRTLLGHAPLALQRAQQDRLLAEHEARPRASGPRAAGPRRCPACHGRGSRRPPPRRSRGASGAGRRWRQRAPRGRPPAPRPRRRPARGPPRPRGGRARAGCAPPAPPDPLRRRCRPRSAWSRAAPARRATCPRWGSRRRPAPQARLVDDPHHGLGALLGGPRQAVQAPAFSACPRPASAS